ncbi:MAG: hypothetical protein ACLUDU_04550 [Butyricimonas faecihominis]
MAFRGKREMCTWRERPMEVTRDEEHPFVVSVKNFDVRVLGTSFNVMSMMMNLHRVFSFVIRERN